MILIFNTGESESEMMSMNSDFLALGVTLRAKVMMFLKESLCERESRKLERGEFCIAEYKKEFHQNHHNQNKNMDQSQNLFTNFWSS